jgi:glutathione S-transferase
MKLHWSPKSPYVRKVMVVAHELGLADRLTLQRSVAMMSACNPAIMADSPLNKIPVLVRDDGEALVDSRVIAEYFTSLAPGQTLLPASGPERWWVLGEQAMADGLLDLLILWRNERDKPAERQTQAWLDAFAAKTAASLDRFERLAPTFEARPFGLAHVALGCALSYLDFRFAALGWRENRPRLAGWHAAFEARPSARATEIVDA